ncbi:hypothetical protein P8452_04154 [Trifolium repens]|nr:hypothetical protein P8452_04154 [Trifolium repens]
MNSNEEMVPNHDTERSQESHLVTTKVQHQSQNTNTTIINNHHASPSAPGLRPRGRPLGSKNKPKASAMVPCDVPNILCCEILKVPHGVDLSKAIKDYICRKKSSIYIMSANGCVDQVTLHTKIGEIITFQEKFDIVSMSGSILLPPKPTDAGVSICLSRNKGEVVAGDVIPPLVASGPVLLTVCPLANTASENISQEIYNQEEHEPVCPVADEHMAKDGDDLLDAEGLLNGMENMKSSNVSDPSSSTQGPMF